MLDLVIDLVKRLVGVVVDLGVSLMDFSLGLLGWLHESPRLEGLVLGVALAWVMLRRDRHPLLRVVSAPLKLVLDILDLAWNQVVEVVSDVWSVPTGWLRDGWAWCVEKVTGAGTWVMGILGGLRDRLSKSKD